MLATEDIHSENRCTIVREDQRYLKKSERAIVNFIYLKLHTGEMRERRQRFSLKSLFSQRMSQVVSTPLTAQLSSIAAGLSHKFTAELQTIRPEINGG